MSLINYLAIKAGILPEHRYVVHPKYKFLIDTLMNTPCCNVCKDRNNQPLPMSPIKASCKLHFKCPKSNHQWLSDEVSPHFYNAVGVSDLLNLQ